MKVSIASDHAGYELKSKLVEYLNSLNYEIIDKGPFNTVRVNYPDYAKLVVYDIQNNIANLGILVCGTGIGMSIAANKSKGIRCGLCTSIFHATMTRAHNNANIMAIGGRYTKFEDAAKIAEAFLTTDFEGGRHQERIDLFEND